MDPDALRLAIIVASTRQGRFGTTVADWFVEQARQRADLDVDVVDLAEAQLPGTITAFGEPEPESVTALAPRLARADAFVVVTPEYNHSYPASLKTAVDWFVDGVRARLRAHAALGRLRGRCS